MENPSKSHPECKTYHAKIGTWENHSFPVLLNNQSHSKMTYTITKSIPINEKMTILYVKQNAGNRTRSVQFNISKVSLKVVTSDYDKESFSRVRLTAAFESDPNGVNFNSFCADLNKKIDDMKNLMVEQGFDCSDFLSPTKTLNDDVMIFVKVKSKDMKEKLKDTADHVECRATVRVNCLWRSDNKSGISLELTSFTPL